MKIHIVIGVFILGLVLFSSCEQVPAHALRSALWFSFIVLGGKIAYDFIQGVRGPNLRISNRSFDKFESSLEIPPPQRSRSIDRRDKLGR